MPCVGFTTDITILREPSAFICVAGTSVVLMRGASMQVLSRQGYERPSGSMSTTSAAPTTYNCNDVGGDGASDAAVVTPINSQISSATYTSYLPQPSSTTLAVVTVAPT